MYHTQLYIIHNKQHSKTEKWPILVAEWYPREGKTLKGRPVQRWVDNIKVIASSTWKMKCHNWDLWKHLGEANAKAKQS